MDDEGRRAERIVALLDLGRYADAAADARTDLAHDPESATLHQLLAQALIGQDEIPAALPHARAAVALEPDSPEALQLLAGILAEVGEGAQARDAALRAVRLAPNDWLSHVSYAHALLFGIRGRDVLAEAEAAARRSMQLAPHEPQTHLVFGIVRWRLDDFAMAEDAFRHALALDPAHADAQRNLASLQLDRVNMNAGADTLARGLSAHPQDRGMHDELARAHTWLLSTATWSFVATALLLGGFMLATDFLLRQRAWYGLVMLVLVGARVVIVLRRLPAGSVRRLLPWGSASTGRARAAADWSLVAVAALVWFAPASVAGPAWVVLAAATTLATGWFLFRIVRNETAWRTGKTGG